MRLPPPPGNYQITQTQKFDFLFFFRPERARSVDADKCELRRSNIYIQCLCSSYFLSPRSSPLEGVWSKLAPRKHLVDCLLIHPSGSLGCLPFLTASPLSQLHHSPLAQRPPGSLSIKAFRRQEFPSGSANRKKRSSQWYSLS